ncbi:MAG: substrate-binding domain-containing protein [Akkermansiaceae bacterium]|jgi:tungstate transport system substrate-binding protein|nr:substrate-binding domain-containing protein [Akkermansiaceae bacterium]
MELKIPGIFRASAGRNKRSISRLVSLGHLLAIVVLLEKPIAAEEAKPQVRAAVINGMIMTGFWQALMERFTNETGIKVELAAAGERDILNAAFRKGGIDFLTMHSGDVTTNLVADGFAMNMRPWAKNELVIVGPSGDPAGIQGMKDGVAALKQIAAKSGKFVDFRDLGSREVFHTLLVKSELAPDPAWLLQDTAPHKREILNFAESRNAYAIVGSLPVRFGRMPRQNMIPMVQGDAIMRRPYNLMVANPKRFPKANVSGAEALAEFLLTEETQRFIATFGKGDRGDDPYFYPVDPDARSGK